MVPGGHWKYQGEDFVKLVWSSNPNAVHLKPYKIILKVNCNWKIKNKKFTYDLWKKVFKNKDRKLMFFIPHIKQIMQKFIHQK